jgi:hypothetical protein
VTWNEWKNMGKYGAAYKDTVYRIHWPDGGFMYAISPTGVGAFVYTNLQEALKNLEELKEITNG